MTNSETLRLCALETAMKYGDKAGCGDLHTVLARAQEIHAWLITGDVTNMSHNTKA